MQGGEEDLEELFLGRYSAETECQSANELLAVVLRLPEEVKLHTICLLWAWSTERNKANNNKQRLSAEAFEAKVGHTTAEWWNFLGRKQSEKPRFEWK